MQADAPSAGPRPGARGAAGVVAALAALLLHWCVFDGAREAWTGDAPDPHPPPAPAAVSVRPVTALPTPSAATPAAVVANRPTPAAAVLAVAEIASMPASAPLDGRVRAPVVALPGPAASAPPPDAPAPPTAESPAASAATGAAATSPAPAASAPEAVPAPVYRTAFGPAALLRYELRAGPLRGDGELRWQPVGERYELELQGRVAGFSVLTQRSTGAFDVAGLAPERFTDRRRRDTQAANFRRDSGRVSFSGPSIELPLAAGMQDRLSWMLQLAAIVSADPSLAERGRQVAIWVVGARGDADVWVFEAGGGDSVEALGTARPAVRFTRRPRKPYDTAVEVWLDPALHHWPVRVTLTPLPRGDALELLLRSVDTP